jgi:hypothetical protein
MIDMRGDGEVQYDGFEYNWWFRPRGWRAEVGRLSTGGWVRRRRWIRLMVKPGNEHRGEKEVAILVPEGTGGNEVLPSPANSLPPSVVESTPAEMEEEKWRYIWNEDDVEGDWHRCHVVMRALGSDGRKLDMWRIWLGGHGDASEAEIKPGRQKQWTEDEAPMPSEVDYANAPQRDRNSVVSDKGRIASVLCAYVSNDIMAWLVHFERVSIGRSHLTLFHISRVKGLFSTDVESSWFVGRTTIWDWCPRQPRYTRVLELHCTRWGQESPIKLIDH